MCNDGKDVHEEIKKEGYWLAQALYEKGEGTIKNLEDLVRKYSGRLFTYIRCNRKLETILQLEKLYASVAKQPGKHVLDILKEQDSKKFQEYALAFMMGFLSNKKEDDKKGGKNDK